MMRGGALWLVASLAVMPCSADPLPDAAPPVGAPSPPAAAPADQPPGQRIAVAASDKPPVSLYVEEHGSGPPLLLLHGLGESTFTWHEILPRLAAKHRVIALDLKGFGRSDKPDDGAYTADDQAALVARFIVDRNLDGVTVIGHSFGGSVALRLADQPEISGTSRVRRFVVIGAPALPRTAARRLDIVKTPVIPDTLASALPADAMARLLLSEAMGGQSASEEDVAGYAAPYTDPAALKAFFATARAIVGETDRQAIAKRFKAIRQPVLVVWCRKDPIVPVRSGRQLAAALPKARFKLLEGCHHLPQHETPQTLLSALETFLAD